MSSWPAGLPPAFDLATEVPLDAESDAYLTQNLLEAAREDINCFVTTVMRDERTGLPLEQAEVHRAWHRLASENDRLMLWSSIESGKAVPLTTAIPTPTGFVTMGELRAGDTVLGRDGRPCAVTFATPTQFGRRVYLLRFDDGSEALADADHRWLASRDVEMQAGKPWRAVSTAQMLQAGVRHDVQARRKDGSRYQQNTWRMPLPAPVQYPPRVLPVAPYVLGAWLGNGDSRAARLTFFEPDRFVYDRCVALEGAAGPPSIKNRVGSGNVGGFAEKTRNYDKRALKHRLRALGLLGNKHIPELFLTASIEQREELLAGLLDTDGYICPEKGRVEFCNTNRALAEGTLELARSLGFKATLKEGRAMLRGRDCGPKYRVSFTPGLRPVFRLPRKLAQQRERAAIGRATYRCVVAIEEAPSVPVRCISVDSEDSSYLMGREYLVTHNTSQLSIARTLYELGRDKGLRIGIVSNTAGQSQKVLRSIKRYIESSPELHAVFPDLRPSQDQWTTSAITVKRNSISKDPSIQAIGVHGNILGSRLDLLIVDDLLDVENTRSAQGREDCFAWLQAACLSRLTAKGRVLVVGTAFHPDDALHRLARMPGFKAMRYPVLLEDGTPRWAERWPPERIARVRETLGPLEFARQLLCVARSDDEARFKKEWIDVCLARGEGKQLCYGMDKLPPGFKTYTGVDLAVQQKDSSDFTVLFTIAIHPNTKDREVLNIERGKWSGPEIVSRIIDTHRRFLSIVVVENNASQDFIIQFARGQYAVPIRPFTTGRNKAHPEFGIEALATELAGRKWIIPSRGGMPAHPEIATWVQEMLYYQPASHTGDSLMASWFAKEGERLGSMRVENGRLDVLSR